MRVRSASRSSKRRFICRVKRSIRERTNTTSGNGEQQQGEQTKPPGLPEQRLDLKGERGFGAIEDLIQVAGNDAEAILAGAEVGIGGLALGHGLAPAMIEIFEHIPESSALRDAQAEPGVIQRDPLMAAGNAERIVQRDGVPVNAEPLNVYDRRGAAVGVRGMDDGEAAQSGDPDISTLVRDYRAMTPHSGHAAEAVGEIERTQVLIPHRPRVEDVPREPVPRDSRW